MRRTLPLASGLMLLLISCSPSENVKVPSASVEELYLGLANKPGTWSQAEKSLAAQWSIAQVPMALEVQRLSRDDYLAVSLYDFIGVQTKQKFGFDRVAWQNWLWSQDYKPSKNYPNFKSQLYRKIDPKFASYFSNDRKATIRLDEVVWGGVLQDGIPPLRNPKMISASSANYLADSDIVFGIEVNGDARAYPKRILAWHEMFVDTIQGVPLAGVY